MSIRVVDAGMVSGWRSQATYHGVARVFTDETPDTIVVLTPRDPHVCIGFHQNVVGEVDLDYCAREGLPVIRREIGGGTVLLDDNQLFVQWIFRPSHLPRQIGRRFELFTQPMILALGEFGIRAAFVPANDVQVDGRKIAATGAGAIEDAEVVVGNFVLDFDHERMTNILDYPDEIFRSNFRKGLDDYMTTMRRELGEAPDPSSVKAAYLRACAETLGEELVDGEFSEEELEAIERTEDRFKTHDWLHQDGGLTRPGKKIHSDVWVYRTVRAAGQGFIRTTVTLRHDKIDDITFDCSFPIAESEGIRRLEMELRHVALVEEAVAAAVDRSLREMGTSDIDRSVWIRAILEAKNLAGVA